MNRNRTLHRAARLRFWALGLLALLLVPLGGSATAAPGGSEQLQTVKVAILPLEPVGQVLYAKHRGFFRKQGLDVRIEVLADPTQTPAALLSGNVQFAGLNLAGLAFLKSGGAPIKAVAAGALYDRTSKTKTSALVAMPSKRIRSARDLVGKRIAVDQLNTIAHLGMLKWLKQSGVQGNQVNFTTLAFAKMLGPLVKGEFDAAFLPEPYLTLAKDRGARVVAYPFDAVCSGQCLLTMWSARSDIDKSLAAHYRAAIQAAAVWANRPRNRAASAKILAKYVEIKPALLARIRRTTFATRLRTAPAQPWIDVFAELGVIPKSFPASDLVK